MSDRPSPRRRKATPPAARTCNLPPCSAAPEWRGLCPAHRQTHRGLADPKGAK